MVGVQALTGIAPHTLPKEKNKIEWRSFAINPYWWRSSDCSDQLADFLNKMISYNSSERYQNATEALKVLSNMQKFRISIRFSLIKFY